MAVLTTILDTDLMSASRVTINSNFASLNTAKIESAGLSNTGRLVMVTGAGTLGETASILESSGKVGIAVPSPAYTLDIAGDCNVTGTYRVNGSPFVSGSPQTPWTSDIDAAGHKLINANQIAFQQTASALAFTAPTTYNSGSYVFVTTAISYPNTTANGDGSKYATAGCIQIAAQDLVWGGPTTVKGAQIILEGGKSPNAALAPGNILLNPLSGSGAFGNVGIATSNPTNLLHILYPNTVGGAAEGGYALNIDRQYDVVGDWTGIKFGGIANGIAGIKAIASGGGEGSLRFGAQWASNDGANNFSMKLRGNGDLSLGPEAAVSRAQFSILPWTNPTSVATATQLLVGEATNSSGYGVTLGYFIESGTTWKTALQSYAASAGAVLLLNPLGGNVGIGNTAPGLALDVTGAINASNYVQAQVQFYGPNNMTANPACLHISERSGVVDANQPNGTVSFDANISTNWLTLCVRYSSGTKWYYRLTPLTSSP